MGLQKLGARKFPMKTSNNPPPLSLIKPSASPPEPPCKFEEAGLKLWRSIQAAYQVDDIGGITLLVEACHTADRVAAIAARINDEGEVVETRNGLKEHPGLRAEQSGRAFIVRVIQKLGINTEPIRPVGRPPKSFGWRGHANDE
jgi:hypothetical protein